MLQEHVTPSLLPTRVLELSQDETIRQLETGKSQRGTWIALSHCWGAVANHLPKLTQQTLSIWNDPILTTTLPQTIRDAIQITRALRVAYI